MVKVFIDQPYEYYLDGYVKTNLDVFKENVSKDFDFVVIVDGREGAGKSTFAQQAAFYLDPTLNLNRIVFDEKDFRDAVIKAEKFQAIVWDEAYGTLNTKEVMSKIARSVVAMLAEIRQKNLFIFIVLPSFFDLHKNVAMWRSHALFHVYLGNRLERGYVAFYNYDKKKQLYVKGKKFYNYWTEKPNFIGRFVKFVPVDYEHDGRAYFKKKADSLTKNYYNSDENQQVPDKRDYALMNAINLLNEHYTMLEIEDKIKYNHNSINLLKQKFKKLENFEKPPLIHDMINNI